MPNDKNLETFSTGFCENVFWECLENPNMIIIFKKMLKPLYKYCLALIRMAFRKKLLLESKLLNCTFLKAVCLSSVALNINFNNEEGSRDTKITRKCKGQGI